jgi:hypothetical protein
MIFDSRVLAVASSWCHGSEERSIEARRCKHQTKGFKKSLLVVV